MAEFAGTDRFEIRSCLGAGGMGVVYEAFDREQKQTVALKTLKRFDGKDLIRFKNEFRSLHDIDHPNLIRLYELSEEDGQCFFTMELVRGTDFLTYVRGAVPGEDTFRVDDTARRPSAPSARLYDEPRLRAALAQLARGVGVLHAAGKVHRDIKPSNIQVTEQGRVVLLDLGLVTHFAKEEQSTATGAVGTAAYMAPEQAISGNAGPAADWYSVGVVLYEALTMRLPHIGKTAFEIIMNKQEYPPPPPRQRVPGVPTDLDALCVELLDADPEKRPPAHVILDRLGVVAEDIPAAIRTSTSAGFTQTTPFIGREDELALLHDAFADSMKNPIVMIVEGESGLGKSALVQQFADSLTSDGAVVLTGRCYERESVAYKAFDGIVDELSRYMTRLPKADAALLLPRRAGLLPRLFPVLQRVECIAAAPRDAFISDPQEMRRRMFGALRELLARLALRHPLVLVIDDLQWTDSDSLTLLQELLGDDSSPNLLIVATMRPVGIEDRARILASVHALEQRQIDLAAFSIEHAKELAAILLPSFDDEALSIIAREAEGHPLFVMELARYAQNQSMSQSQNGRVTLEQSLWQRISQLPADLLTLLKMLCVAGTPISQECAANAAEMSQAALSKAALGLRISYLVRTSGVRPGDLIEPYHDRIREIVAHHLSETTLQHCHHRLALALEQAGAARTAPQILVRHAEAAGDPERAAAYAEAAAEHAIDAMAFDQAAELFQTALRLGEHGEDKTRALRLALARALVNAGRGPEAAQTFLTAGQGADPATQLECQRQAAEQWLLSGHTERGLDAMGALLSQIGVRTPASPRRALLSLVWQRTKLSLGGLRWTERAESDIALGELTRIDVYKAVSHGLSLVDTIRGADFQTRGLLLALRAGEPFRVARALFTEALFVAAQGGPRHVGRAQALAEQAKQLAGEDPYLLAWKSGVDALLCYLDSRFRPAAEHAATAESQFLQQAGVSWELSNLRLFHAWSLLRMGLFSQLAPLVDAYVRDAARRGDLYTQTTLVRSCHALWLAKGDLDAAQLALDETHWEPPEGHYHLQHWFSFQAQREIDIYRGCATDSSARWHAVFAELKKSLLSRAVSIRSESRYLRGRLALASALGSKRSVKRLKEAAQMARLLERQNNVYATASAHLLRAAIAAQEGDTARAVSILAAAAPAAEGANLFVHAASARRRHGELLGGDEGAALIAAADEWMIGEGIKDPARMTEVYAPGFGSSPANGT